MAFDGLLSEPDRAVLRPDSASALAAIATHLAAYPARQFHVVGHTDAQGSLAYNLDLSAARAAAVIGALATGHGVARARLGPQGVGPLVPVFSNDRAAG